jgi:hypothetical protein
MATAHDGSGAAGTRPLDAERARLRDAGLTDDEISKIFIARELGTSPQPDRAAPAGVAGQIHMSGVLANLNALWAHAGGIIPTIATQFVTVFSRTATASARLAALLSLMVKAALLATIAYVVMIEFAQLKIGLERQKAESCSARMKAVTDNMTLDGSGNISAESLEAAQKVTKECGGDVGSQ